MKQDKAIPQPKDESKEGFTGGEWDIKRDATLKVGPPGQLVCSIYKNEQEEANAALISQAKNMYYALKEIRNWYEQNALRLAPDTPICFSKALSVLQQANPLFY